MKCSNCNKDCILKDNQFCCHDGTFFSGYVCEDCKVLYENPKDSIFDYDDNRQKKLLDNDEKEDKK